MGEKKAFKRGRVVPILLAGFVGYMLGGWNASTLRTTGLSAAQMVALRFPQDWRDASDVTAATVAPAATAHIAAIGDPQFALLDPQPMVAQTSAPQASAPQASGPQVSLPQAPVTQVALQTTAVEQVPSARASDERSRSQPAAPVAQATAAKPVPAPVHRHTDRPGFILNDAQIASIKERLNLTPDQEQMWPAVEAALRNIAYTRAHEAHRRGNSATAEQLASTDPNSVEVQGLKSAAVPLIMSFNSEQKDEVRSLAHVMGLDQLASQF